jgi:FAD/FMN-containing dehydrogenase
MGNDNARMLNAVNEILILALASNFGSFEYCHGIGIKLSRFVKKEQKMILRKIKNTLDPNNIMNPNKMIG